ncbi:MAG: PmoA family protein [Planctomycetes bacterium]|nr:PmoA family protein [Planctomycetota bacterium]
MIRGMVRAEVAAERSERGVVVKIDGELFTEYLMKAGQSPALWPVIGPTGKQMTRSWPVGPPRNGEKETDDHPHHQSIWFTHDKVNGADFWKANVNSVAGVSDPGRAVAGVSDPGHNGPHIAHREFKEIANTGSTARIITRNDWMDGDKRICEDERVLVFGTRPNRDRWIDFTITIKATDGDVTFGDTKEGTFAVRVADPMRVDAKLGGRIVNSEGQTDEAAWGMPAKWVNYTGPVTTVAGVSDPGRNANAAAAAATGVTDPSHSETLGIAIYSHPKSFRPEPRWHVRTYGLFTANPFGQQDFPKPELNDQGPVTIKKGDSLTLRYRVLLHRGTTNRTSINAAFDEFAAK